MLVYSDHLRTVRILVYFLSVFFSFLCKYFLKYSSIFNSYMVLYKCIVSLNYCGTVMQFILSGSLSNTATNIFIHKAFLYLGFFLGLISKVREIGSRDTIYMRCQIAFLRKDSTFRMCFCLLEVVSFLETVDSYMSVILGYLWLQITAN